MTVAPLVRTAPAGPDRLLVPLPAARAALARLSVPVEREGELAAFPLAPGGAELVWDLLRWLGWGEELGLPIQAVTGSDRVPAQRGAEDQPPRPDRSEPVLDLCSPDLLRLLDRLADACLRLRLGLPPGGD